MATVAQVAQDRPYIVGLASTFTTYASYPLAQAAAITASAGASSAPYYVGQVSQVVTAGGPTSSPPGGRVDIQPGTTGPDTWIIQLGSTTTYLPEATAIAQAFTTSAANSNAPVYVARTFQTVTGP